MADAAGERLAVLTLEAAELESEALCWQRRGLDRYAVGCLREAMTIREEAQALADLKFADRAKPRPAPLAPTQRRLARASRVLRETAKAGREFISGLAHAKAEAAIDELYRFGGTAKPTDRNGWPL